jgi:hypothetical protein
MLPVLIAGAIAVTASTVAAQPAHHGHGHGLGQHTYGHGHNHTPGTTSRVLLISVDGLHQSDLKWYVRNNPNSVLAQLAGGGVQFTNAHTPIPSDSFPGMLGPVTGGDPRVTGVYYDAEFNHNLISPGSTCSAGQATTGGLVHYDESIDQNQSSIDAGQGLAGLPGHPGTNDGIMQMESVTADPSKVINVANLPLDPANGCQAVWPWQYLQVNTVFNVIHDHGMLTAWSDKHPAYSILNGPSGNGIDDLFAPEINSNAFHPDGTPYMQAVDPTKQADWTQDNAATRQYDSYKVQAILNEIDGCDHSGNNCKGNSGVPAIFGMNFQTISTAEKLPLSEGTPGGPILNGGYLPGTHTPGPLLSDALNWLDGQLGAMVNELAKQGLTSSTAIILTAKHGQSPRDPNRLVRIDDGPIITAIDNAWTAKTGDPNALIGDSTNDDAIMMWLTDRSSAAARFVKHWLMTHSATGTTYNANNPAAAGPTVTLPKSGLVRVFTGNQAARYFGVSRSDPRNPNVWGIVRNGVVYTGGTGKIAEHGGANSENRDVPLIVYAPGSLAHRVSGRWVETTQIAPTILQLLGLDPNELQAVRAERTPALPLVSGHHH